VRVVSVPLAVAEFDQQAGFLDPVIVSVACQQPACPFFFAQQHSDLLHEHLTRAR